MLAVKAFLTFNLFVLIWKETDGEKIGKYPYHFDNCSVPYPCDVPWNKCTTLKSQPEDPDKYIDERPADTPESIRDALARRMEEWKNGKPRLATAYNHVTEDLSRLGPRFGTSMASPLFGGLNFNGRDFDFSKLFKSIPRAFEIKASQIVGQVKKFLQKSGGYEHWMNMSFGAGDIIHCELIPGIADHVLLATSDSSVIHMIGSTERGRIVEESWTSYHGREGEKQSYCDVMDSTDDPRTSISNARKWTEKSLYYNLIWCNCEHWVNYWTSGDAVSYQTFLAHTNAKCPI